MNREPFPHIRVSGPPGERGQQYGKLAAERIKHNIAIYESFFQFYTSLGWEEAKQQSLAYIPPIEAYSPRLVVEMEGIAAGAGLELADILVLNLRTEILNAAYARQEAGECTAVALLPEVTADGNTYIGQNWDWRPHAADTVVVLEVEADDIPNLVTVVEAGMLAKSGMNAAGIGVTTNALATDQDKGQAGVPYHVILRGMLESYTLTGVVDAINRKPRASAANYMAAHKEGLAFNAETAPGDLAQVHYTFPEPGYLVHTNHFIHPQPGFRDIGLPFGPSSITRWMRMRQLIERKLKTLNVDDLQHFFADHFDSPTPICRHPDEALSPPEQVETVASVIMDIQAGKMWLADGPPCITSYRLIDYQEFFDH